MFYCCGALDESLGVTITDESEKGVASEKVEMLELPAPPSPSSTGQELSELVGSHLKPMFTRYPIKCLMRRHTKPVRRSTCVAIEASPAVKISFCIEAPVEA